MALKIETIPSAQRISRSVTEHRQLPVIEWAETIGRLEPASKNFHQEVTLDGIATSQKGCLLMTFGAMTQMMALRYRCKTKADLG